LKGSKGRVGHQKEGVQTLSRLALHKRPTGFVAGSRGRGKTGIGQREHTKKKGQTRNRAPYSKETQKKIPNKKKNGKIEDIPGIHKSKKSSVEGSGKTKGDENGGFKLSKGNCTQKKTGKRGENPKKKRGGKRGRAKGTARVSPKTSGTPTDTALRKRSTVNKGKDRKNFSGKGEKGISTRKKKP